MTAINTNIATDLFLGDEEVINRLRTYPRSEIALPIIVVEEIFRGRLNFIRKHQKNRDADKLTNSYRLLYLSSMFIAGFPVLQYSSLAEQHVVNWCKAKIRVGSQDMRIAAICIENNAALMTRNRSDFAQLTGLSLELWN